MDLFPMVVLAVLMFGFAYFALRNVRNQLDEEWEREFFMRDRRFRCEMCGRKFEFAEYVDSPFSEAVCPYCGSNDTLAWFSGPTEEDSEFEWEPTPLSEAIPSPHPRELVGTTSRGPRRRE